MEERLISCKNTKKENGETDFENESLTAGMQNVSITDANGCITQLSIELNQPTVLEGYADVLSDYNHILFHILTRLKVITPCQSVYFSSSVNLFHDFQSSVNKIKNY